MLPVPFTLQQFLEMIEHYNATFGPIRVVAVVLGISTIVLGAVGEKYSSRISAGILAFYWIWVGIFFNGLFFSRLYALAIAFAALFLIQGLLFVYAGIIRNSLSFSFKPTAYGVVGAIFIFYGIAGYPLIEYMLLRGGQRLLSFGITPCPTTVFTLGMLLWSKGKMPKYVLIIPFVYSVSGIIPILLGITEDIGLVVSGIIAPILILYRDRAQESDSAIKSA